MKITKLFKEKCENPRDAKCPCIAFLGDSVTQGCFELYKKTPTVIDTIFDQNSTYHGYLKKIFAMLYPEAPMTVINAGLSGDTTTGGLGRLNRDVIKYEPDLTVVCFGLNDCIVVDLETYCSNLKEIFTKLQNAGSEVIFMTPNSMNINVSPHTLNDPDIIKWAEERAEWQLRGDLKTFVEAGKKVAEECGVKVCDVYRKWELMIENGVNITELLANRINHPTREMNWLFAYSLAETMMS